MSFESASAPQVPPSAQDLAKPEVPAQAPAALAKTKKPRQRKPQAVPAGHGAPACIGYARISADDPDMTQQREALHAHGCSVVFTEEASILKGFPQLEECFKSLRAGDTLMVWRLDRLGRSLAEILFTAQRLYQSGIQMHCIKEEIKTDGIAGSELARAFAVLANCERTLVSERTRAGLISAKAQGRVGGRPPKLTETDKLQIRALLKADTSVTDICKLYRISRNTFYRFFRGTEGAAA